MAITDRTFRRILAIDCLTCLVAGFLMVLASGALAAKTGLPTSLLLGAGMLLFPVAAFFAWLSRMSRLTPQLVWLGMIGNLAWIAASIAVLLLFSPTLFGFAFVIVQAAAVAVLATLEYACLMHADREQTLDA